MTQKRYNEIPKRQKCVNKEEPYIGGAVDVFDDAKGKNQEQINEEVIGDSTSSMKNRLNSIEGQFEVSGGSAIITTDPDDIVPGSAAIPTGNAVVGAIERATTFHTGEKIEYVDIDNSITEDSNALVKSGQVYNALALKAPQATTYTKTEVDAKVDAINEKIPAQASSSNQLADKNFVNSSISTATATFKGTYNLVTDLNLTVDATEAQIKEALGNTISTADNNDYAFVQIPTSDATPTQIAKIEKYKYNGSAWAFEYELNNSGFTAAQWAAINSGATLELIGKLSALPTNAKLTELLAAKQNVIQDLANIRSGASAGATAVQPTDMSEAIDEVVQDLENGDLVPAMAETLEPWADQKAIATPDTYTDAVRTTGGDIPIETSAGSKPESIKPVAGSKWTAKMLFNGSYNMLNAAKWGAANSQPYVGGVGSNFVYFLVPELTLGTFGTADENNGLLFTDSEGENVQPTSVYFKPLGATVPQSLTDGTSVSPTSVSYDGKTYKDYATDGAGWLIIPKTYYDNDVCAHIAWEDWYDKYVSLDEPTTNPEAVVGTLILEGLLALAHADKYLRGVNDAVCDNVVFGDTSATISHMVDELSVATNSWTNAATGESDSHGNSLYRHSATVSGIKQGGAACIEAEDGGIPLTVNGTTVSYIDTNATAPASVVFYEVTATSTTKAYTDSIFNGSNINTETGILPINDCSIEAQVAMDGKANITVKYAKNIVDQVAINATVDVPQIKREVENHEERITNLEDTAVRTGSYDASVAVGLADNFKGDTIVDAEFYKRKTGGTQSVGSGIAAIKEVRGKSIVWNQLVNTNTTEVATISGRKYLTKINDVKSIITSTGAAIAINDASVDQVFDITLMFGTGNEPTTVEEFEKMFPLDYYDYNAGEVIPFAGQNLTTTGKNQYNPATGKANLLGGQTYQLSGTYTSATIDGVAVTLDSNNCFTTTKDCVLDVTGGNDTDTIVALYNGENVTFEPYEGHTLPLDPSQWRDKQGNLAFPYGGMHGVGGRYDYAKVDADGYIRKAVRCFGQVDLGTLTYTSSGMVLEGFIHKLASLPTMERQTVNLLTNFGQTGRGWNSLSANNGICSLFDNGSLIGVRIKKTDLGQQTMKQYFMAHGSVLNYRLATPVEVELATPVYAKYLVDKDGTEEITPANGATPYTTMANLSILYAMDARGEIKNLPKNYLSKESAENMLNAMVSAGVIASYTMTWDVANNRYAFVITAPVEPVESNE